jgi:AraC-like DNA-binding protein
MDTLGKKLDFFVIDWQPFARRFPGTPPVTAFQVVPEKAGWVRHTFSTCNFSLILAGSGTFHRQGRAWRVESPCVLTQWPGEPVSYGPDPGTTWREVYFIYPAAHFAAFRRSGLIDRRRPVWPIAHPAGVAERLDELAQLSQTNHPEHAVDRVDRVVERILLETLLPPAERPPAHPRFAALAAQLRADPAGPVDFRLVAAEAGMSDSTFRRRWEETFALPPARYLLQQRMHRACRLLASSRDPIHEIARAVGFEDEFYFSRCFRRHLGVPPREYRRACQLRGA